QPRRARPQPRLVETRGSDDGVQAPADAPAEVVQDRAGVGEIHHHVASGQRVPGISLVHLGGDGHAVRACHRLAYLRAHAPLRAEHTHFDHDCLPFLPGGGAGPAGWQPSAAAKGASSSNGPTTASTLGRPRICAATRRTSSWVTASMQARISSTGSSREYTSSDLPRRLIREDGSSRPSTSDPRSWPLPRSSSAPVRPREMTWAIPSGQIASPSSALAGRQPMEVAHMPLPECCDAKLYTE